MTAGAAVAMVFAMISGLSHPGATPRELAYATTDRLRARAQRVVQPNGLADESRDQIRDQVLAERGVNRITVLKLTPQARIEVEISVITETARRAHPVQARTTGTLIDLKV